MLSGVLRSVVGIISTAKSVAVLNGCRCCMSKRGSFIQVSFLTGQLSNLLAGFYRLVHFSMKHNDKCRREQRDRDGRHVFRPVRLVIAVVLTCSGYD